MKAGVSKSEKYDEDMMGRILITMNLIVLLSFVLLGVVQFRYREEEDDVLHRQNDNNMLFNLERLTKRFTSVSSLHGAEGGGDTSTREKTQSIEMSEIYDSKNLEIGMVNPLSSRSLASHTHGATKVIAGPGRKSSVSSLSRIKSSHHRKSSAPEEIG